MRDRLDKAADWYTEQGFDIIPVLGKRPARGFTSHGPYWHQERKSYGYVRDGIAAVIGDHRVVIDIDPRNGGSITTLPPFSGTWQQKTRSGGTHLWFRDESHIERPSHPWQGIDVLKGKRYVLLDPSPGYEWLYPPWKTSIKYVPDWLPTKLPDPWEASDGGEPQVYRAEQYAAAYPPAVSGEGGHARTFVLASRLVHQFHLDDATAMRILERYNDTCRPSWSQAELKHKLSSARSQGSMARGVRSER